MSTVKQRLKQSLTLIIFIAATASYNVAFAESTEDHENHATATAQSTLWSGVYQGFTPCDDCKGIKTTLALNKNNTYILISQYIGKSDREIVEKGKFIDGNSPNAIILTPKNSTQTRHYLIGAGTLTQLDSNGNVITGKEAERYVLRRNELSESQHKSAHH